jgi:protease II
MSKIMELARDYRYSELRQVEHRAAALAAAIQAEQDYTRAVISEREALRKELAELRLQVISDIGQEIES